MAYHARVIEAIRTVVAKGEFEVSRHALERMLVRHIALSDVVEAIANAEVIEDYPDDKYGPSCLLLGFTRSGRAIHVQVSHPSRVPLKIVTIYGPGSLAVDRLPATKIVR